MKRIHLKPQDPCWCGSGRPYGECHQAFDQKIAYYKKRGHIVPPHSLIRTPAEIAGIQASAEINTAVLDAVAAAIHAIRKASAPPSTTRSAMEFPATGGS